MKQYFSFFLAAAFVFAPLLAAAAADDATAKKPNVIWVVFDALRAQNLSSYGYERNTTPFIDALAKRGVLFEDHYVQANGTLHSVPSYMTGRYFPVFALGYGRWLELSRQAPPEEKFISEIMATNGYRTTMINAHHFITKDSRLARSFQEHIFVEPSRTVGMNHGSFDQVNTLAFEWLEEHGDEPFFLYIHTLDTHWPHYVPPPFNEWVDESRKDFASYRAVPPMGQVSPEAHEYLRGIYDGSLAYADACMGALYRKLEELGLAENTVVVLLSDHGEALGEDGNRTSHMDRYTFDDVLRTPCIMLGPGLPEGRRVSALTENADLVPTMIDLLDLETEATTDGVSLVPIAQDPEAPAPHDMVFSRQRGADLENDVLVHFVLRSPEYKYYYNPYTERESLWHTPDRLGERKKVENVTPELLAPFREALKTTYMPKWDAYDALPYGTPASSFYERIDASHSQSNVVVGRNNENREDDQWTIDRGYFATSGDSEDAPPAALRIKVPNGRYRIAIDALNAKRYKGTPASALKIVSIEDQELGTVVTSDPLLGGSYLDLGEHEVSDGFFDIVLQKGSDTHWAHARGFRFTPISEDGTNIMPEEDADQLRALGYLE